MDPHTHTIHTTYTHAHTPLFHAYTHAPTHTHTHSPSMHTGGIVDYGPFPVTTPTSTLRALLLANDTQTLFGIPIAIDNLVEGDESFFVALSIANEQSIEEGGIVFLGNLTMATVVITDNDGK